MHTKCTFRNRSCRCFWYTGYSHWRIRMMFWCRIKGTILRIEEVIYDDLSPITVQLFGSFHWRVSISFFGCLNMHWKYMANQTMPLFRHLNPVCCLNFVPSLRFKPNLQAAVCSLHFILHIDRSENFMSNSGFEWAKSNMSIFSQKSI